MLAGKGPDEDRIRGLMKRGRQDEGQRSTRGKHSNHLGRVNGKIHAVKKKKNVVKGLRERKETR